MGTRGRIVVLEEHADLLAVGEELAHQAEARWSRFRTDSELMRLNRAAGGPVRVSAETFALVTRAVDAWARTGGRFDPTGLDAIRAAGYDRDFAEVVTGQPACFAPEVPLAGCAGIGLDPVVPAVALPVGVALDLGGIAKGHTADQIAGALRARGADAVCVDLGGDVRVLGTGPYAGAWEVAFADEPTASALGRVRLAAGAVTTSTTTRRRWTKGGVPAHHLLDPVTGAPSRSGVETVTVVADEAGWGEVLAKAALVAGVDAGLALLTGHGVDGLLVTDGGARCATPGFGAWCTGAVGVS